MDMIAMVIGYFIIAILIGVCLVYTWSFAVQIYLGCLMAYSWKREKQHREGECDSHNCEFCKAIRETRGEQ